MTATLTAPDERAGLGIQVQKDCVICPVCGVVTGSLASAGPHGLYTRLCRNASGYEDGTRCRDHSRTRQQREAQSKRALRWVERHRIESQLVHE